MKFLFRLRQGDEVELERRLRADATLPDVPADLHDAIISSLEQTRGSEARKVRPGLAMVLWLAAPALAVCLIVALFAFRSPPPNPGILDGNRNTALAAPGDALVLSHNLAESLPSALSPLTDELNRVQSDISRTTDFLVASMP